LGAGLAIAALAKFLPRWRLFGRLVLANSAGGSMDTTPSVMAAQTVRPGDIGVTCSALRPYGTVEFSGQRLEAVVEAGYIQSGLQVRVREIQGIRIIVEPVGSAS